MFDAGALAYDTYRPRYPSAMFDEIISVASLTPGSSAIDVGCGTGIGTIPLIERGLSVLGIEPSVTMAEIARAKFGHAAQCVVCRFEDWKPGASVDLVVSFNSWHWIDPVVGVRRASDVLRPGGWLALMWTDVIQYGDPPFEQRLADRLGLGESNIFEQVTSCVRYVAEDTEFVERETLRHRFERQLDARTYLDVIRTYGGQRDAGAEAVVEQLINEEFGGRIRKVEEAVVFLYQRR